MKVFVVDDHPLMREAVVLLMRRIRSNLAIVELDRIAAVAPAATAHGLPDLICLDLKLPDAFGVSGVREVKQLFPQVPLIVLSSSPASDYEDLALEAGADVYLEKSAGATEITAALRELLAIETESESSTFPEKLSRRQQQLIVMLDKGQTNREIADELGISEHTVKVHLWRLFRRLNVSSRTQATHLARTHGML